MMYFTPDHCVDAQGVPTEFAERVRRVTELPDDLLTAMRTGIYVQYLSDKKQQKYFNHHNEVEAAKEIRDVLRVMQNKVGDIKSCSLFRKEIERFVNDKLREGAIELTDEIYNQTMGIAAKATMVQNSTFPSQVNRYVSAGYAIATYIQDTSNFSRNYVPWEMFAYDGFKNLEGLEDAKLQDKYLLVLESVRQNVPWRKLIDMQSRSSWQATVKRFKYKLKELKDIDRELYAEAMNGSKRNSELKVKRTNCEDALNQAWEKHIEIVRKLIQNNYWEISTSRISFRHPDYEIFPVHISYSVLSTKYDIEQNEGYDNWVKLPTFKGRIDERIEDIK